MSIKDFLLGRSATIQRQDQNVAINRRRELIPVDMQAGLLREHHGFVHAAKPASGLRRSVGYFVHEVS
ncbi:hypothetical protein ACVIHI_000746 [Bradyrhizobium sp. USDA 4524]|uniref:hypothetical protein n=1 Tax=unclassified Bradyrhizobium TaxID=2631580 RepID=UPI00209E638C|nr:MULTISPECIES: hypothetical protein [unclassified Bradyrhizobium]MCP1837881.1 hypothetical protein [Bradyrhizobium sp. USDA 4538]MCP1898445.1 hypothetical protein [Bradyrhizobium sp. USDA 4537]MCP1987445.1 hypothetical protein [Bradyrhizobium sp. USDA 4539]